MSCSSPRKAFITYLCTSTVLPYCFQILQGPARNTNHHMRNCAPRKIVWGRFSATLQIVSRPTRRERINCRECRGESQESVSVLACLWVCCTCFYILCKGHTRVARVHSVCAPFLRDPKAGAKYATSAQDVVCNHSFLVVPLSILP